MSRLFVPHSEADRFAEALVEDHSRVRLDTAVNEALEKFLSLFKVSKKNPSIRYEDYRSFYRRVVRVLLGDLPIEIVDRIIEKQWLMECDRYGVMSLERMKESIFVLSCFWADVLEETEICNFLSYLFARTTSLSWGKGKKKTTVPPILPLHLYSIIRQVADSSDGLDFLQSMHEEAWRSHLQSTSSDSEESADAEDSENIESASSRTQPPKFPKSFDPSDPDFSSFCILMQRSPRVCGLLRNRVPDYRHRLDVPPRAAEPVAIGGEISEGIEATDESAAIVVTASLSPITDIICDVIESEDIFSLSLQCSTPEEKLLCIRRVLRNVMRQGLPLSEVEFEPCLKMDGEQLLSVLPYLHRVMELASEPLPSYDLLEGKEDVISNATVDFFGSEEDEEYRFEHRRPLTVFVTGKPGSGKTTVAKFLADQYNLVHFSIPSLIQREIDNLSTIGMRIRDVLNGGGSVGLDLIIEVIRAELHSFSVQARGYVFDELPQSVSNDLGLQIRDFYDKTFSSFPPCLIVDMQISDEDLLQRVGKWKENPLDHEIYSEWDLSPPHYEYRDHSFRKQEIKRRIREERIAAGENEEDIDAEMAEAEAESAAREVNEGFDEEPPVDEDGRPIRRKPRRLPNGKVVLDDITKSRLVQPILYLENIRASLSRFVPVREFLPRNVFEYISRTGGLLEMDATEPKLCIQRLLRIRIPQVSQLPTVSIMQLPTGDDAIEGREAQLEWLSSEEAVPIPSLSLSRIFKDKCPVEAMLGRAVAGNPRFSVAFRGELYVLSSENTLNFFVADPLRVLRKSQRRYVCNPGKIFGVVGGRGTGKTSTSRRLAETENLVYINVKDELENVLHVSSLETSNHGDIISSTSSSSISSAEISWWGLDRSKMLWKAVDLCLRSGSPIPADLIAQLIRGIVGRETCLSKQGSPLEAKKVEDDSSSKASSKAGGKKKSSSKDVEIADILHPFEDAADAGLRKRLDELSRFLTVSHELSNDIITLALNPPDSNQSGSKKKKGKKAPPASESSASSSSASSDALFMDSSSEYALQLSSGMTPEEMLAQEVASRSPLVVLPSAVRWLAKVQSCCIFSQDYFRGFLLDGCPVNLEDLRALGAMNCAPTSYILLAGGADDDPIENPVSARYVSTRKFISMLDPSQSWKSVSYPFSTSSRSFESVAELIEFVSSNSGGDLPPAPELAIPEEPTEQSTDNADVGEEGSSTLSVLKWSSKLPRIRAFEFYLGVSEALRAEEESKAAFAVQQEAAAAASSDVPVDASDESAPVPIPCPRLPPCNVIELEASSPLLDPTDFASIASISMFPFRDIPSVPESEDDLGEEITDLSEKEKEQEERDDEKISSGDTGLDVAAALSRKRERESLRNRGTPLGDFGDACPVTYCLGEFATWRQRGSCSSPARIWRRGSREFAVFYKGVYYLCATEQAQKLFLSNPERYVSHLKHDGVDLLEHSRPIQPLRMALFGAKSCGRSTLASALCNPDAPFGRVDESSEDSGALGDDSVDFVTAQGDGLDLLSGDDTIRSVVGSGNSNLFSFRPSRPRDRLLPGIEAASREFRAFQQMLNSSGSSVLRVSCSMPYLRWLASLAHSSHPWSDTGAIRTLDGYFSTSAADFEQKSRRTRIEQELLVLANNGEEPESSEDSDSPEEEDPSLVAYRCLYLLVMDALTKEPFVGAGYTIEDLPSALGKLPEEPDLDGSPIISSAISDTEAGRPSLQGVRVLLLRAGVELCLHLQCPEDQLQKRLFPSEVLREERRRVREQKARDKRAAARAERFAAGRPLETDEDEEAADAEANDSARSEPPPSDSVRSYLEEFCAEEVNLADEFATQLREVVRISVFGVDTGKSKQLTLSQLSSSPCLYGEASGCAFLLPPRRSSLFSFSETRVLGSVTEALELVRSGLLRFSKFGLACPVTWTLENDVRHLPVDYDLRCSTGIEYQEWLAVAYRKRLFFVRSRKYFLEFRLNLQKFLSSKAPYPFRSLRASVIGPPKSGKTTLARSISSKMGLLYVQVEECIDRQVMLGTPLGIRIKSALLAGDVVPRDLVSQCVKSFLRSDEVEQRGCIMDNFPSSMEYAMMMENDMSSVRLDSSSVNSTFSGTSDDLFSSPVSDECIHSDISRSRIGTSGPLVRPLIFDCILSLRLSDKAMENRRMAQLEMAEKTPRISDGLHTVRNRTEAIFSNSSDIMHTLLQSQGPVQIENRCAALEQQRSIVENLNCEISLARSASGKALSFRSRWSILDEASDRLCHRLQKSTLYAHARKYSLPVCIHRLSCVSRSAIRRSLCSYKTFCVVEWVANGNLVDCSADVENTRVFEYKDRYFYLSSDEAVSQFCSDPSLFFAAHASHSPPLPNSLPRLLSPTEYATFKDCSSRDILTDAALENPFDSDPRFALGGYCPVTLSESPITNPCLIKGQFELSVEYEGHIFLLSTEEVMDRFMRRPWQYTQRQLPRKLPPRKHTEGLSASASQAAQDSLLRSLPALGYLEQSVAEVLVQALLRVSSVRPIHPRYLISGSALRYIALYLQAHNPRKADASSPESSLLRFERICELVGLLADEPPDSTHSSTGFPSNLLLSHELAHLLDLTEMSESSAADTSLA